MIKTLYKYDIGVHIVVSASARSFCFEVLHNCVTVVNHIHLTESIMNGIKGKLANKVMIQTTHTTEMSKSYYIRLLYIIVYI